MGKFEETLLILGMSPWTRNMNEDPYEGGEQGDTLVESAKPKLKKPPLYQVILLNDDYTPMDFVVHVLMRFFSMNEERATQVMLAVHTLGKAVCGVYSKDVAETLCATVNQYARENQHPLLSEIEAYSDDE